MRSNESANFAKFLHLKNLQSIETKKNKMKKTVCVRDIAKWHEEISLAASKANDDGGEGNRKRFLRISIWNIWITIITHSKSPIIFPPWLWIAPNRQTTLNFAPTQNSAFATSTNIIHSTSMRRKLSSRRSKLSFHPLHTRNAINQS